MKQLINLHFASEYSFLESPTNLEEYVNFAKTNGIKILPLTDHNYVFGFAEFAYLCKQNDIKPIFGLDLDVEDFRLILLAKNKIGYQEILQLSYQKSQGKLINVTDLNDTHLYIINHPTYGTKKPETLLNQFKDFYFYEIDHPQSNIFVNDNRIVNLQKEEALFFVNQLAEKQLNEFQSFLFSFDYEIPANLVEQTHIIAHNCNVVLENQTNLLPDYASEPDLLLRQLVEKGKELHKWELNAFEQNIVNQRINYELSVIEKMQVANYFLIIADLVNWAKKQDISVGPGRGSVSGSLIAYLTGITAVNPLVYNLYFERFLNEERITMPDIDLDIQDDRREEVLEYLKQRYGYENVSQICTFQRIGAKQALKDAGRFLNLSFADVNELSKLIPGSETLAASYTNNVQFQARIDSDEALTKLFNLATKIESLPRQSGIHAAGVVITKTPMIEHCPIMEVDGHMVSQISMEYLEPWGLLKIDLLGLRTLTLIKRMEQNIQQIYDPNFRVEQIPLNDPKTNRLLSEAKVAGIFQLESPGMMATLEKVKVDCFTDLVDVISLFRPGPMSNFPKYLKNKANPQLIPHINEAYDQVIRQSHGIIIYQEQIMEIVQKVAGLSFAQTDILRKAISKKNRIEIAEMQALFIKGALNQGTPLKVAEQIYHEIEKFAQYGFNKSHAVAYATVSYKMAYLKTKFPICFYSVLINLTAAVESINRYVKEARLLRFNIESPSVNKVSQEILHNKKDTIWLPISFIKGIGMAVMQKLIKELATNGPFQSFFDFICRAKMINLGNSAIDILIEANALREFGNMKTLMHNKTQAFNYAAVALTQDRTNQTWSLDKSVKIPPMEFLAADLIQESQNEIKYLGMIYNAFITAKYEGPDKLANLKPGIEFLIVLHINKKRQTVNKFNKITYILEVSDSSGQDVIFFNEKNRALYDQIQPHTIGYASLIRSDRQGAKYLYLNQWREIK